MAILSFKCLEIPPIKPEQILHIVAIKQYNMANLYKLNHSKTLMITA